jgi:hypothetical protein
MDQLWAKSKETNAISHGERIRGFRFKPKSGSYSKTEVYHRADALRIQLEKHHPGKYSISVAVRDRHVAGWRSGKFSMTSNPEIYIYSPEEYDKEYSNIPGLIELPDLVAEEMVVYVKRETKN